MKSLGSRLTCWYAFVVMATVVSTLVVGYWLLRRELIHGIDLLNAAEFREIQNRVEFDHRTLAEGDFLQRVAEHAEIDAPLYFFQVRRGGGGEGGGGDVLFRSPNMRAAVLEANPPGRTNRTRVTPTLGLVRVAEFREGPFQVQIATSLRSIRQLARYYLQVGCLVSGAALALSIFLGHRLSRLALDPLRRIQQTAQRISADNLGARIREDRGNDEIAGLARLLNQMFDRLETSFVRLGRFAGDASHELKTPLSLIRLQSEKLLLHGNLAAGQQEVVQQQLESIHRLGSLIERLLFLAKSEVGGIRPEAKRQDTAGFIERFREDAQVLCEDQGVVFAVVENAAGPAVFDATLLRQVLLNLLTNALRVTPPDGRITLTSRREAARWAVSLEDRGPGLPAADLERIFEPFARVDLPVVRPHPAAGADAGTGLGLSICRSVLEVHRGSVRAENRRPGPGLRVTFEIPVPPTLPPESERADLAAFTLARFPRNGAREETLAGEPRG